LEQSQNHIHLIREEGQQVTPVGSEVKALAVLITITNVNGPSTNIDKDPTIYEVDD